MFKPVFVRSANNYDMAFESLATAAELDQTLVTVQSTRDETDINIMLKRFAVTGQLNGVERPPPLSAFDEIYDFQTAMNLVRSAQESFYALDATVKERFHYDPQEFLAFCSDDANLEEMRKLGIALPKPPPPEPVKPLLVEVVPAPVPPPK